MKSGFVSLIGLPNAGKSTLVNALVGEKVGIVSAKPQTTRRRVVGIYNDNETQACFIDSPGKIKGESGLNRFLECECEAVLKDGDVLLAVLNVDCPKLQDLLDIIHFAAKQKKPWLAIVTKTDLDDGRREAILRQELVQLKASTVAVSVAKNPNAARERVMPFIRELLPAGPPLFDGAIYTTQSERELVAEIIREKCFENVHKEVPYGLAVRILKFEEPAESRGARGIPKIEAEIIVAKESFVPIVLGENGRRIRHIGVEARREIEKLLGQQIFLKTHVKLKRDWPKSSAVMRELGYVSND